MRGRLFCIKQDMEYIKFLPILEMCMEETISQKSKLCEAARITSTDIINRAEILHDVIDKVKETLLAKTENVLEMEVKKMENHEKELRGWISWLSAQTNISHENVSCIKRGNNIEPNMHKGKKELLASLQRLCEILHSSEQ